MGGARDHDRRRRGERRRDDRERSGHVVQDQEVVGGARERGASFTARSRSLIPPSTWKTRCPAATPSATARRAAATRRSYDDDVLPPLGRLRGTDQQQQQDRDRDARGRADGRERLRDRPDHPDRRKIEVAGADRPARGAEGQSRGGREQERQRSAPPAVGTAASAASASDRRSDPEGEHLGQKASPVKMWKKPARDLERTSEPAGSGVAAAARPVQDQRAHHQHHRRRGRRAARRAPDAGARARRWTRSATSASSGRTRADSLQR